MNNRKNDPKSLGMFLASMVIFGSVGLFRRNLPLSSAFLAFSRGLLGGGFVLAFMLLKKRGGEPLSRRAFLWLALSGAFIGINWILLFEAYNHTSVAVATLCYYMQPTIVILLSPLVFRERLTAKKAACAALAVLGMVLVSGVTGGEAANLKGILLGLGAAVFYSAVVIMNKKAGGIDAFRKTAVQLFAAGIAMVPYLLLSGGGAGGDFTPGTVALLLAMGLVHTGIAYALYFGSMDGMRAQSVAILSYADPVFALFFSAVFLREPLSLPCILGAVLIIGSAVAAEIPPGRKRTPKGR